MTLKEAIKHAEEKAKCGGRRCGRMYHAQLAEWLRELQERRAAEPEKHTEERAKTHACDLRRYAFGNDEFNLEDAYHDCKLVFDGITDDDSFQEADTGLILYYANEIIYALHEALQGDDTNVLSNDSISRQEAIDTLTSGVILVTNNNVDAVKKVMELFIDKIKNLPSVQPKRKTGRWIKEHIDITDKEHPKSFRFHRCSACGHVAAPALFVGEKWLSYCPHCGAYMGGDESV